MNDSRGGLTPLTVSISEASRLIGVSRATITRMVERGQLRYVNFDIGPRGNRIRYSDLVDLVEASTVKGTNGN